MSKDSFLSKLFMCMLHRRYGVMKLLTLSPEVMLAHDDNAYA